MSTPPRLDSITFGILRRPADAPDLPEEELDALQERHLAYLQELRELGVLLAAGPLDAQPDEALRGLCFFAVDVEEAYAAAQRDPSVQAGRLTIDVMTWRFIPGEVIFDRAS
jgi:uncharacterized protein YciI